MPIHDPFAAYSKTLTDPVTGGFAITPDDDTELAAVTRALLVTGAGSVTAEMKDGMTLTLPALGPGVLYPFRVVRVLATGTTATGILGLY